MMTNVLLEADSLAARPEGLAISLRLPWYRSLPLSVIQLDELRIDGTEIPAGKLRFQVNGQLRPLAEMAQLTGEYWFVQDSLVLVADQAIAAGEEHEVDVTLSFYPPYIADFRRKSRGVAQMKAA